MNCRSAESLFSAFLDDELSQAERRNFESHILGCRRCSQSVREMRAAMALVVDAAAPVATSPHFEDDVMERIRSGEAMRPTVIEWLQGFLAPERLRPVFVVGASACAVFVAFVLLQPKSIDNGEKSLVASRDAASAPAPGATTPEPAAASTQAPEPTVVAAAPSAASRSARSAGNAAASNGGNGIVEIVDRVVPTNSGESSGLSNPNSQFVDEYVTDQFYLQRGTTSPDASQPSLVPVTDKTAHDVYIEF